MMRFAIGLVAAALCAAQRPAASRTATCRVEGVVVSAASSEPLKKAQIMLFPIENPRRTGYTTTSGADGRFGLGDIEPGKYHLSAYRPGFIATQYGARKPNSQGTTLVLERDQIMGDLVVRLIPQAVITGRVVDEDGDPVAYAHVQVTQFDRRYGKRGFMWGPNGSTNDLGEYRIAGVAPGRYLLSAATAMQPETPVAPSAHEATPRVYAQTYYPGTIDPAGARAVEVGAGAQVRGLDVMLAKTRVVSVKGRVDPAPIDAPGIDIQLNPRKGSGMPQQMGIPVDSKGNFALHNVIPGSYTLIGHWYVKQLLTGRQEIEVGEAGVGDIVLTGGAGMELTGRVSVEGRAEALGDAWISMTPVQEGVGGQSGQLRDDGSFKIPNVTPDQFKVHVIGLPENLYVKAVRFAGRDVLDTGIDLTRNAPGPIDVIVSINGGQVTGSVTDVDEKPLAAALVAVIPGGSRREDIRFHKQATTDQRGRFTIRGITPGEYKLFAWDDAEYGVLEDPEFFKPIESKGKPLSIREGSRETVELKVIAAEKTPARDGRD